MNKKLLNKQTKSPENNSTSWTPEQWKKFSDRLNNSKISLKTKSKSTGLHSTEDFEMFGRTITPQNDTVWTYSSSYPQETDVTIFKNSDTNDYVYLYNDNDISQEEKTILLPKKIANIKQKVNKEYE